MVPEDPYAAPPSLRRYLLEDERVVVAVHRHWAQVAEPVASTLAALIVALAVDTEIPAQARLVATVVWWLWFAVVARAIVRLLVWRHDWFVATDKRLLLTYGLITEKVAMMPLMKVTDMSYGRSIPGRLLGYGQFVLESAGADQALRTISWVPRPDGTYRAICAEIFGAGRGMPGAGSSADVTVEQPAAHWSAGGDVHRRRIADDDTGPIPVWDDDRRR